MSSLPPMTGNGISIPPIKMVMTGDGFWYCFNHITIWPSLLVPNDLHGLPFCGTASRMHTKSLRPTTWLRSQWDIMIPSNGGNMGISMVRHDRGYDIDFYSPERSIMAMENPPWNDFNQSSSKKGMFTDFPLPLLITRGWTFSPPLHRT